MRLKTKPYLLAAAALLTSLPSVAQTVSRSVTVHLDLAQTKINWTLGDVLHTVHGTFRLRDGLVKFDPVTGAAQGELIVEASSGDSGNKMRDGKMQKDVLESGRYPEIIFHPAKVTGAFKTGAPSDLAVSGTFTIHGADHPLTLKMHVVPSGNTLTMTTSFEVPYVAWGMKDPSTLMLKVSKDVSIEISGSGTVDKVD
jgi:polyisoprenoid-binding protein YceI